MGQVGRRARRERAKRMEGWEGFGADIFNLSYWEVEVELGGFSLNFMGVEVGCGAFELRRREKLVCGERIQRAVGT